jgi:predicted benzoate:H+ symporter BenE
MILTLIKNFAQTPPPKVNITKLPHQTAAGQADITNVLSIVFAVLGGISVIMIIIGGIKYAGSQGDPAGTAKAKNTIIYAIIGVVVAIFAVTIVQFTIGKVFG